MDREISERTVEGDHLKHLIEENAKVLIYLSILYLEQLIEGVNQSIYVYVLVKSNNPVYLSIYFISKILIEEYLKELIYLSICPFPL